MKIVVSIVIYKSSFDILSKNLHMFSKQDFLDNSDNSIEIVICDNDGGSQIQETRALLSRLNINNIHFIESDNVGFGGGHNKAFSFAKKNFQFDYFLIVNPDGIPHPRMLKYLVDFAKNNKNNGIFEALQFPVEHPKKYDPISGKTNWCSGCCCLFPYEVFEQTKGFDDNFFMYMEDVDISWRARSLGYECYSVVNALFSHSIDNKDRDLTKQNILMYKSAYKLALKYQNKKFANKALLNLEKLITKSEIALLNKHTETIKIENIDKYKNIANFQNKFYFSEARW